MWLGRGWGRTRGQRKQKRTKGEKSLKKSQPGLEGSCRDREKDSRNPEQRRARNREGKGGQEFGFHLNHLAENGLATLSKDFLVIHSEGSVSVLNRPCSSLGAISQDLAAAVPGLASALVSLSLFPRALPPPHIRCGTSSNPRSRGCPESHLRYSHQLLFLFQALEPYMRTADHLGPM